VFRVLRNTAIRETQLTGQLRDALASALPSTWRIVSQPKGNGGDKCVDASLALTAPDQSIATILIEVKRTAEPRDVAGALRELASFRTKATRRGWWSRPIIAART